MRLAMIIPMVVPMILGLTTVLQGGLNRLISTRLGLGGAVILNAVVMLLASLLVIGLAPQLRPRGSIAEAKLWFIIPGLCGLFIVFGIPAAIERIGALRVFVGIIAAQLIGSLIWDALVEGISIQGTRIIGAALAFAGVVVASLR